ncbi:Nif3-like dinuclear metal center hexameric protein [Psychrobacter aestuarii]|uniref:Nif3-like dinuclear metal center hexameric protein n=1 Tax=Psychrobacter aestuarii TaxID=556327 RepID=A0ABN0VX70_9GAMM|nr:Nif3-like dinuclear metal center hexameric protein [Psychrobacter aestuarii]
MSTQSDTSSTPNDGISAQQLTAYCDDYLSAHDFKDYCPNGLQVDGGQPIRRIVTGVTACEALIDAAIADNADAILVHHGYFWKGEPAPLTGMKGTRIRKLLTHGISLITYHLPLDAHPKIGNNAILAELLDLEITGGLYPHELHPVGNIATCAPQTAEALATKIATALGRTPLHIAAELPNDDGLIRRVGLCTGGAQDMIEQAAEMGCDAYISGEISERTTHSARELGIHYFAAGHHATERGGIEALGEHLKAEFNLPVTFIDIDNPA